MALEIKTPHTVTCCILYNNNKNTDFYSIIDIINSSKYLYTLTADAPIYVSTLTEFWANAKLSMQNNKKPFLITSTINKEHVKISVVSISTMFHLEVMICMETYPKNDLQAEFIERGYEGQMVGATLFKPKFSPEMKLFFHTLLVCLYAKTTSFNKIPLKP
ncbi:hypothetical protein Hanom_Chr12g01142971 [Helianthus anomalus]